ncbi:MAG: hypothetical protein VKJ04_03250 [Vampirovibrionales bacterium]|nr:hypothetical protein [Vampirovibrionales bacterium]
MLILSSPTAITFNEMKFISTRQPQHQSHLAYNYTIEDLFDDVSKEIREHYGFAAFSTRVNESSVTA